jgi:glycosyltransferase involved in cell wall biosynthesis
MPIFYPSNIVRKALTMLAWQERKEEIEVILINDCSPNTDCDYKDLLDEFNTQLNIKYLKTENNSGPGVARQLGLDNCSCDWVMFHDDDDTLNNPYVIEAYLDEIEKIPQNVICVKILGS